jgi:hypothetical protein
MRVSRFALAGLGQDPEIDPAAMQAVADATTQQFYTESSTPYVCNAWQLLTSPAQCASAASPVPPVPSLTNAPNGGAPIVTITVGAPQPGAGGSSIMGYDSNNDPIYANTPTAQQQQQIDLASLQSQMAASGYVDCSSLWNQITNSKCPCTYCSSTGTLIAVGVAALVGVWLLSKV